MGPPHREVQEHAISLELVEFVLRSDLPPVVFPPLALACLRDVLSNLGLIEPLWAEVVVGLHFIFWYFAGYRSHPGVDGQPATELLEARD